MNTDAVQDTSRESILVEVVDEFTERLDRGEQPQVEEYAERHPEVAETIRQVLPALQAMRSLTEGGAAPTEPAPGPSAVAGRLGDYRILREIGRGGMGVVYEAEQVSLGRRVALKVLPFAAVLDQRQLQRFKNEAQAAAQLHHQNIVPVYSVGCERGVHYYAMQYIEGRTLASVIGELSHLSGSEAVEPDELPRVTSEQTRSLTTGRWAPPKKNDSDGDSAVAATVPATEGSSAAVQALASEYSTKSPAFFRSVGRLGIQAAEALDHAHQSGVLHRDIKPSNLLLDARGHLWITDFGLAHMESDPGLTMTGDILGTVRYMSPEQALAKRIPVDHRTDIYSLGVTLYELLTLQPAFTGRDRQELLRQITFEEPRRPRRLNGAIPTELETIVLKAVSKNPEERYATSQDLADDLERFLEDKPIRAKRPSLAQRAAKWSRRHRAVVASGVVLLLMAVVALSISTALIWQEQARTGAALAQAQANYETAETQRERAEDNFQAAEWQRQRAEANFQKARDAVDRMLTRVADELAGVPHMEQIRRALLEDALEYYEGFLQERSSDPLVRYETAHAFLRVAQITRAMGQNQRAEETYRGATSLLEELSAEFPDEREYRKELGEAYWALAVLLKNDVMDKPEALEAYRRSFDLRAELVTEFPDDPGLVCDLAWSHADLGLVLSDLFRYEEALKELREALALREQLVGDFPEVPEYRFALAHSQHWLGSHLWGTGRVEEAEQHFRPCLVMREKLVSEFPNAAGYQHDLAHIKSYLAALLIATGRDKEAEQQLADGIELLDKLVADFPHNDEYRHHLGDCYLVLGRGLLVTNRPAEAKAAYRQSVVLFEELVDDFPDTPRYCQHLLYFLANCPDPQFRDAPRAVELGQRCLEQSPHNAAPWRFLGVAQYRDGQWEAATDSLERAMELKPDGYYTFEWFVLAMAHWQLGDRENEEQARRLYDQAVALMEQEIAERPGSGKRLKLELLHAEAAELLGIDQEGTTEELTEPVEE